MLRPTFSSLLPSVATTSSTVHLHVLPYLLHPPSLSPWPQEQEADGGSGPLRWDLMIADERGNRWWGGAKDWGALWPLVKVYCSSTHDAPHKHHFQRRRYNMSTGCSPALHPAIYTRMQTDVDTGSTYSCMCTWLSFYFDMHGPENFMPSRANTPAHCQPWNHCKWSSKQALAWGLHECILFTGSAFTLPSLSPASSFKFVWRCPASRNETTRRKLIVSLTRKQNVGDAMTFPTNARKATWPSLSDCQRVQWKHLPSDTCS